MSDFVIDPMLVSYASRFDALIAAGINKAILDTRAIVMAAAPVESGQTKAVFQVVNLASPGNLSGGIGQLERVGDPFAPAPRGRISEFLKWYGKNA